MRLAFATCTLLLSLLCGCTSVTQKMSDTDRRLAAVVTVDEKVTKPESMFYSGGEVGAGGGQIYGAVGALISSAGAPPKELSLAEKFSQLAEKNGIRIEDLVREEITAALKSSDKLKVAGPGDTATSTIRIQIERYGFGQVHGLSDKVGPLLRVACTLVDANGRTLWSATDYITPMGSAAKPVKSVDFLDDPKVMGVLWRQASKEVARLLVREL